ncbi:MAG TPA: arginine--tRNA ligase [Armatimonadota bacterium]|nr:arginine--tRNA ligase [Armatimonadota bacterium]
MAFGRAKLLLSRVNAARESATAETWNLELETLTVSFRCQEQELIQDIVAREIRKILGGAEVSFNIPPTKEIGDFSTAVALALAGKLRRAPLEIARETAERLRARNIPYVVEISVTPPGYINFKIDHPAYARDMIRRVLAEKERFGLAKRRRRKVFVEHTNVNPNKAMHIGHVRNAVIGDTVSRVLRRLGYNVEVANYIDDTGVQVADVVAGMLYLDEPVYDGRAADMSPFLAKYDGRQPFDYYCWDLYARVQEEYGRSEALLSKRSEVLRLLETGDNPVAAFGKELSTRILTCHLAAVARLDVFYDLLNWESDVLARGFWTAAFERLKAAGAVVYEESGPNAGCWIVPFGRRLIETKKGIRSEDKILVRSDGTVTYTGKDIAYQMWKLGVLGVDFLYELWGVQPNGRELWTTAPDGEPRADFGHADEAINVIDVRQSYAQQIVYQSLRRLGCRRQANSSRHLSYEVVVLSGKAAKELGLGVEEISEEGAQAMSGRRGIGVKADDLINEMVKRLEHKVHKPETAHVLAAAAVRYFMSRFGLSKMIVFDFDEALRTTGDTGVYLEYAHARACSMLAKAGELDLTSVPRPNRVTPAEEALVRKIEEFPAALVKSAKGLSPTTLARYAFDLATAFTDFYENPDPEAGPRVPFIRIRDPELRTYRLALVAAFRQTLANALDALGIVPLERI